jgi:Ricin-type beta-trefoil lectin domain-like
MFRFLQRFGRDSQTRWRGTRPINRVRRRNHQLNCEALEGRQLLSFSGYYLANAYSGKVLDDPGGTRSLDAPIEQYQLNGGTNQLWQIIPTSNGYGIIVNTKSGEVMRDTGDSSSGPSLITQWDWNGAPREQWMIYPQANGTVEIQNLYTGKFLDNPNFSTSNLTPMIAYPWNGGANQQWNMVAAGSGPVEPSSLQNASSGSVLVNSLLSIPLADGNDLIVDSVTGQVLDGVGNDVAEGSLTGALYQQWYIAPQGNGYVGIVNASSYMVMDQTAAGTLVLDAWYDGASQQWQLYDTNPAY